MTTIYWGYVIKDMIQGDEKGNFYFYGWYISRQWSSELSEAKQFDSKQDAISALKDIKEKFGGTYQIIKIYY